MAEQPILDENRRKRLAEFIAPFRVEPGTTVTLREDFDPRFKAGIKKKKEASPCCRRALR